MICAQCGTQSLRDDQRFCAGCGTDLAPATQPVVEPPPAYHPPAPVTGPLFADDGTPPAPARPPSPPTYVVPPSYPQASAPQLPAYQNSRSERRRAPIVLLAVAALVAALIGAGGVVLFFGNDDDDPASDTSAEDSADGADSEEREDREATTAPDDDATTATETESATDEPASFRCWDGGPSVVRLADCSPPSGVAGLAWVFPSAEDSTCVPDVGVQRAAEVDCSPIVDGEAVRFHYSEWRTRDALENYYGGNTLATIAPPGGRADLTAARVTSRASDVGYKVALYYADPSALWSVTIYAADEAQYRAAVAKLEARPFQQLRGERG